ncbi:MAG: hypothetical protein ACYDBT_11060 [Desulfobulbaceae bacterium]
MSKQFWANLAVSLVLGSLAIFAAANFSSALSPKGLLAGEPQPSAEAAPLLPQVILARYQVGESLDRVVEADFYIQNGSDKDVKNIEVFCEFFDEQGGYVDRKKWTLPETVPAGQAVRLNQAAHRFVSTRARALNCRIADFQLVKEPFFTLARVAVAGHGAGGGEAQQSGHAPAGH